MSPQCGQLRSGLAGDVLGAVLQLVVGLINLPTRHRADRLLWVQHRQAILTLEFAIGVVEAELRHVEIRQVLHQRAQLGEQLRSVPFGFFTDPVVSDAVRAHLDGLHVAGDVHGHFSKPEQLGRHEPRVPNDDDAQLVDDDRLAPAILPNALRNLLDGKVADSARAALIGFHVIDRPIRYRHRLQLRCLLRCCHQDPLQSAQNVELKRARLLLKTALNQNKKREVM